MGNRILPLFILLLTFTTCEAQQKASKTAKNGPYTFERSSRDGIGKFYMGREISQVMGHLGASWLERREREKEEKVGLAIRNMDLKPNEVVADIGAGSGYYAFRVAEALKEGKVLAVDLQSEMLAIMQQKIAQNKVENVQLIQAKEINPNLPENSIDMAFMVDVYHELSYPKEVMEQIVSALKPNGRFILLEYRTEDPTVPIKRLHKMSEAQAVKEMKAVGLRLKKNKTNLPWQHFMVFEKQ